MREADDFSARLLAWYAAHARDLPWRSPPGSGRSPDPYAVWLSEVMLQQTTVAAVIPYFRRFMDRWPDVHALAAAADDEVMAAWAGLGYYARARNLLACARVVSGELGGVFPHHEEGLRRLPGIGPYTAAAIAAIAFGARANVVDGNIERVIARHARITTPLPAAKKAIAEEAARRLPPARCGDYAQALMDLGALVCTPSAPRCGACPVAGDCRAGAAGDAAALPARAARPQRPVRRGIAHIAATPHGLVLERRPPSGLLGGMLGWPGPEWAARPDPAPPFAADWRQLGGEVRHVFTHFALRMAVRVTRIDAAPPGFVEIAHERFDATALPTVMAKAWRLAAGEREVERISGTV